MSLALWAGGTGGGCFSEDVKCICIKNRDSRLEIFGESFVYRRDVARVRREPACASRA